MLAAKSPPFMFELDNDKFYLPWTPPDMNRLKLWYHEMLDEIEPALAHDIVLWGGSWSYGGKPSWDVDLFLVRESGDVDTDDIRSLRQIHKLMTTGYQLALNKYRFLLDFTLTCQRRLEFGHRQMVEFESGLITKIQHSPDYEPGYGIYVKHRKSINGVVEFDMDMKYSQVVDIGSGRKLFKKQGTKLMQKQMEHIRNGRVYFPPTRLSQLFGKTGG